MNNTLLERLDAGGSEEREAADRIRELETQLAVAKSNVAALSAQLVDASQYAEAAEAHGGEDAPEWLVRANTRVVVLQSQIDAWTQAVALLTDRMIELEAQLAEANARAEKAERDFKTLCRQTDQRDSEISDQFTLLDKARLEAEARLAEERRAVNDLAELLEEARSEAETAEARVDRLEAALEFYAKPENLEEFAQIFDNEFKGTSWAEMNSDISKRAQEALRPAAERPAESEAK